MKQQDVFNKIGSIIKELNDQYKYIQDNPANLNELELELFVANANFLADHAEILIRLNQKRIEDRLEMNAGKPDKYFEPVVQPKFEIKGRQPTFEPVDGPVPAIDLTSGTSADTYSFTREEPEIVRHELEVNEADFDEKIEYVPVQAAEPVTIEKSIAQEPVVYEPAAVKVPAMEEPVAPVEELEKPALKNVVPVKDDTLTINQRLSAQLSSQTTLGVQPIDNLKQAISLNDKLWFIKDLFNGYNLAYSEAIEILNRFTSMEEAERFLDKNYRVKNKWDEKPDTTDKFYALLRRRYGH